MISIKVACSEEPIHYYDLDESAKLISHDLWGVATPTGVHPETLKRAHRKSFRRYGVRLGRNLYFTKQDLSNLGYKTREGEPIFVTEHVKIGDGWQDESSTATTVT